MLAANDRRRRAAEDPEAAHGIRASGSSPSTHESGTPQRRGCTTAMVCIRLPWHTCSLGRNSCFVTLYHKLWLYHGTPTNPLSAVARKRFRCGPWEVTFF